MSAFRVYLLGHPVSHSLSPAMHNAAFRQERIEATYEALDVLPEALEATLERLEADPQVLGCNVTVPHKLAVHAWLESRGRALHPAARTFGAVNTLLRGPDGLWQGDSTDYEGFLSNLLPALVELFNRHLEEGRFGKPDDQPAFVSSPGMHGALWGFLSTFDIAILGSGGSARTLARGFLTEARFRPRSLEVFCRTPAKAVGMVPPEHIRPLTEFVAWNRGRTSLVVQTTTVGMESGDGPGLSPVPEDAMEPGQVACDIVYKPLETPFLRHARSRGAVGVAGLGMLVGQGAHAWRKWVPGTDSRKDIFGLMETMQKALRESGLR
jgi:shikimate dehydrogenase